MSSFQEFQHNINELNNEKIDNNLNIENNQQLNLNRLKINSQVNFIYFVVF